MAHLVRGLNPLAPTKHLRVAYRRLTGVHVQRSRRYPDRPSPAGRG